MTFEEVLDQAIALLQRRGRLTYRTLKRQFQLDDAALEDLTVELITGQRLAVDEGGEVLVWSGAPGPPPRTPRLPRARGTWAHPTAGTTARRARRPSPRTRGGRRPRRGPR